MWDVSPACTDRFLKEKKLRNVVLVCLGIIAQNNYRHNTETATRGVLKNFAIFTGKTPVLESLFNKAAGLQGFNFIKKKFRQGCFPVNIAKFLKTPILRNIWKWLLLTMLSYNPQSSQCCPNTFETNYTTKLLVKYWTRPHSHFFARK